MAKVKSVAGKSVTKKSGAKVVAAAAKKTTSKSKPAAVGAPKPPSAKKIVREVAQALTTEARRKLLKPRENYDELLEKVARIWSENKSLRVPGLTVARLQKLLKNAERAKTKEAAMREKLERVLRPLYDGRLLAEDEAWRAVLDVNAAVKLHARRNPALAETFGFLTEALTTGGGKAAEVEEGEGEG